MRSCLFLSLALLLLASCKNGSSGKITEEVQRDTSINAVNAYSELFLDSASLENYIATNNFRDTVEKLLRNFYKGRNYQYAWFFNDGITEQAMNFWNLQGNYIGYSGDSVLYNDRLQQLMDTLEQDNGFNSPLPDSSRLKAELALTRQFFRYIRRAYQGNPRLNAQELDWFIPRKKVNVLAMLDSVVMNKGRNIGTYEPVNRQYRLLKEQLNKYYEIQKQGAWQTVNMKSAKLVRGDSANAIASIKKRLHITGDYTPGDTTHVFNDSLEIAVKKFQFRYGLKEDGVIGGNTLREMNSPIENRIRQILINMERLRWMPAGVETDFLLVNIPEYRLHVYEKGKLSFSMPVVVGSTQHHTVIFNGDLKYVVFSPYWNVPPSIVRKEIVPGMQRSSNYLARHNMEITGYSGKLPVVRQKPGSNNSLGRVKFLFPNSYNIYLHDTPAKSLFGESTRAFSHGCIRLGDPPKLARFLLRNDSTWTERAINKAMQSGKEKYVTLHQTVPVVIGYFTAWVDQQGNLNFRDDVYGHDARMADRMFGKAPAIASR